VESDASFLGRGGRGHELADGFEDDLKVLVMLASSGL
jgi:hypothetical protein